MANAAKPVLPRFLIMMAAIKAALMGQEIGKPGTHVNTKTYGSAFIQHRSQKKRRILARRRA